MNVTLLGCRVCVDDVVKLRSLLCVPYPVGLVSPREWEIWVQTYVWGGCRAKIGARQPRVRGPHGWPATQQKPDWGLVLAEPSACTACGHPDLGLWPLELREDKLLWDLLTAPQETTATLLEKTHFQHQTASSCQDRVPGTPRLLWSTDCVWSAPRMGAETQWADRPCPGGVLSRFSCVQLSVTLWTVACQDPLSTGFSRHEWSGSPCPPPRCLGITGQTPQFPRKSYWTETPPEFLLSPRKSS